MRTKLLLTLSLGIVALVLFATLPGLAAETPMDWIQQSPSVSPPVRYWHAMAYDSARGTTVLFGGLTADSVLLSDTWEWDGSDWVQCYPVHHPSARFGHAMAYDSARGVTVLFGGSSGQAETWEWDGVDWVQRSPAPQHPSARYGHAMAYDSTREVTVLFGGGTYLGDTWEWNGTDWIFRNVGGPTPRRYHSMAYDSVRGRTVLYGGEDGPGSFQNETWEWNGSNWALRTPTNHPGAIRLPGMTYDSVRQVTVLFAGDDFTHLYNYTWEWDGIDWIERSPATIPEARSNFAMVFDSSREVTVIFGGYVDGNNVIDDTWEYTPLIPRPVILPIDNVDGDGEYLVDWSAVTVAISYTLEEDDNSTFTSPSVRYQGDQTEYQVFGQGPGEWYYRVKASNAQGESQWSNIELTVVHPEAPDLFPIANGDGDGIYLVDWSDATSATSYELQEDDNSGFTSPTVRYSGANSQYQVNDQLGGIWYYRVRASNAGGNSPWSNTEAVGVKPGAPVMLAISNPDGDGDYLVDWNDVIGATSYRLEEDDNAGFTSPTVRYEGVNSHYQTTGQQGGIWYYRVRASNAYGDSPWSNTQTVWVAPAAPVLLPISNPDGNGDYLVDWNVAVGATAYELQEDDNSGFTSPTVRYTGSNTAYQIDGQQGGTWYYRVRASNAGGNSPWSYIESVGVIPNTPVLLPINNPDGNGDYLTDWSEVTGATSYRLEEDDNSAFTSPTTRYEGDSSQYSIVGQQPGLWYYRVLASNVYGESPWSNTESVGVIPQSPILEPISNPDGNGDYLVDWNDVTGATSYYLEEDDNSEFTSPTVRYNGTNSQYQVYEQSTGLWYYRVRASCAGGDSPWSNIESVSVAPLSPVLFPISNPDGNGDYLVDWSDVTGATSYRLEEDDNSGFTSPTVRYTGINSQFHVYGQESGTWYYRVLAINDYGESSWSNIESVSVIPAAPVLDPIHNPDGDGEYLVDWNDTIGAMSYTLEEDDNSEFTSPTVIYTGADSQYQVSGQQGGFWYYRVLASNPAGDSPWSNIESVGVIPTAPELLPISNPDGDENYLVDWTDVDGVTGYILEEDDNPGFNSPITYVGIDTEFEIFGQQDGVWYYRVRAYNSVGDSAWSNTRSVIIGLRTIFIPILVLNH